MTAELLPVSQYLQFKVGFCICTERERYLSFPIRICHPHTPCIAPACMVLILILLRHMETGTRQRFWTLLLDYDTRYCWRTSMRR